MMLMATERQEIVTYGRKLIEHGLTKGTGGNLSIYEPEQRWMAITPSGIDYFEIRPEDVVVMDLDGNVMEGSRKPSSEYEMHRIFYANRTDIRAVLHTHSTYCTTIACLNWTLPAVHYLVAFAGKDVRCAEYATYGTRQLAENAYAAMDGRQAVLLANHGLLTGGASLAAAFNIAEQIEFCAEVYCRAKAIGNPVLLQDEEMARMKEKFKTYGQHRAEPTT